MVNAFDSTIWPPTPVSPEVKALLARFFDLIDNPDPEASGKGIADEVFTEDGTLITGNGTFQGRSEIARSRLDAWKTTASRRHTFDRVYSAGSRGDELILFGGMESVTNTGQRFKGDFAARGLIQHDDSGKPRVSYWHPFKGHVQSA